MYIHADEVEDENCRSTKYFVSYHVYEHGYAYDMHDIADNTFLGLSLGLVLKASAVVKDFFTGVCLESESTWIFGPAPLLESLVIFLTLDSGVEIFYDINDSVSSVSRFIIHHDTSVQEMI